MKNVLLIIWFDSFKFTSVRKGKKHVFAVLVAKKKKKEIRKSLKGNKKEQTLTFDVNNDIVTLSIERHSDEKRHTSF